MTLSTADYAYDLAVHTAVDVHTAWHDVVLVMLGAHGTGHVRHAVTCVVAPSLAAPAYSIMVMASSASSSYSHGNTHQRLCIMVAHSQHISFSCQHISQMC